MDILKTDLNGTDYTITVSRDGFSSSELEDDGKQEYDYNTFEVSYSTTLERNFKTLYLEFKNSGIQYSCNTSKKTITDSLVSLGLISTDDVTFKIYNDGFRKLCNKNNLSTLDTEYELSLSVSDDNYIYSDKIPEMPCNTADSTNLWITIPTVSTWSHSISEENNGHINITKFIDDDVISSPSYTLSDNILTITYTPTEYYVTITASTYDEISTTSSVNFNLSYNIQYSSDEGSNWSTFTYSSNGASGVYTSTQSITLYIPISYNPNYQWRIYISECTLSDTSGDNTYYNTTLDDYNKYIYWDSYKWSYYEFSSKTSADLKSSPSTKTSNYFTYNFSFVKSAPQMNVYFDNRVRGPYQNYYNVKKEIRLGTTSATINSYNLISSGIGTLLGHTGSSDSHTVSDKYRYRYYYLNSQDVITNFEYTPDSSTNTYSLAHNEDDNTDYYTTSAKSPHTLTSSKNVAYTYITFENTTATDISLTFVCKRSTDNTLKEIKNIGLRHFRYAYYDTSYSKWDYKYANWGSDGIKKTDDNDHVNTDDNNLTITNLSYEYPVLFGLEIHTKQDTDKIDKDHYVLITIKASSNTWSNSKYMQCKIYLYPSSKAHKWDEDDD